MSLYFAYSSNVDLRKAEHLFRFNDGKVLVREKTRKAGELLFDNENSLTSFKKIISYAELKKIDSFELVVDGIVAIQELLSYLSTYLMDKDMSIGLISTDADCLEKNKTIFDYYGVTYSKPHISELDRTLGIPSFCLAKMETSGSLDEGETNAPIIKEKQRRLLKPTPKKAQKLNKSCSIQLEESFHDKFMKLLIESGKDNVEIYKKAGITRQVFSKILSDKDMIPTKLTLVSLCIGLELSLTTAKELMVSAGYSLSRSLMFDSIVMKYLREQIYDFELINSELDEYGCQLLGWHPRDN